MVQSDQGDQSPKIFFVLILTLFFTNLILVALIFAPQGHYNLSNIINTTNATQPVLGMGDNHDMTDRQDLQMILEWRLEDITVNGDYEIQKYREFEIYRDNEGHIIKTIPTHHLEYLRYWRYSK